MCKCTVAVVTVCKLHWITATQCPIKSKDRQLIFLLLRFAFDGTVSADSADTANMHKTTQIKTEFYLNLHKNCESIKLLFAIIKILIVMHTLSRIERTYGSMPIIFELIL